MKKIFILGVGAQKAGTTWLHHQLIKDSKFNFGHRKEYHVFDSIQRLNQSSRKKNNFLLKNFFIKNVIASYKDGTLGRNASNDATRYRTVDLSFIDNIENYFDYFDYLFLKNQHTQAVGDITPQYALLNKEAFQSIRVGLEKRGFTIKIIFLMRDPAERCWSAVKYKRQNLNDEKESQYDEVEFLEKNIKMSDGCIKKSRYERTIKTLEDTFAQENIHYEFYERLFSSESQNRIQDFLGLNLGAFQNSEVINATPKDKPLPQEINQQLIKTLQPTYEFLKCRYGETVQNLWPGYAFLDRKNT